METKDIIEGNKHNKFKVWMHVHDEENKDLFGVWNNDMKAFQYVNDWDGVKTEDFYEAKRVCEKLNKPL